MSNLPRDHVDRLRQEVYELADALLRQRSLRTRPGG